MLTRRGPVPMAPCPHCGYPHGAGSRLAGKCETRRVRAMREPSMDAVLAAVAADPRPRTLDEVGGMFGLTRERVRQIEASGLRAFRARAVELGVDGGAILAYLGAGTRPGNWPVGEPEHGGRQGGGEDYRSRGDLPAMPARRQT